MVISLLGISKQLEVLLIIITGIGILSFDSSLFHMKSNLDEIWEYNFDPKLHDNVEIFLKYVLSSVIFVRTFTLHIFLALYIVMLWPAIFCERPNLMIPWLLVGSVRCIAANLLTFISGSYVCFIQKGQHLICLDFALAQFIQHGPSVYAWLSILSYYKDLQLFCKAKQRKKSLQQHELATRRKKARCMDITHLSDDSVDGEINFSSGSESNLSRFYYDMSSDILSSSSRSLDTLLKLRSVEQVSDETSTTGSIHVDQAKSICATGKVLLNAIGQVITEHDLDKERPSKFLPEASLSAISIIENGKGICKCLSKNEAKATELQQQKVADCEEKCKGAKTTEQQKQKVADSEEKCKCLKDSSTQNSLLKETELNCVSLENTSNRTNNCQKHSAKVVEDKKVMSTDNNFLGQGEEVVQVEHVMELVSNAQRGMNVGCQVNTLSRSLLNQPPEEVTRRYRLSNKMFLDLQMK